MTRPNVLVTCPPMLGLMDEFAPSFDEAGLDFTAAKVTQVMSVEELIEEVPKYEGWIIGDDPVTKEVVASGAAGKLRAAIKWGVGTDNVDFEAFNTYAIPVDNTPGVFGNEVADVALAYTLALARQTHLIDREIRTVNGWPKPCGISVGGKTAGVVGFGDIGAQTARRLSALDMSVIVYDPAYLAKEGIPAIHAEWPQRLDELDYLIFTCPLNSATRHLFSHDVLPQLKPGVRIVNVARGPIIAEEALLKGLKSGIVHSAALDVFEVEPLPVDSELRNFDLCIFGSHNGSNSVDAVRRVSFLAIEKISKFLAENFGGQ